MGKRGTRMNKLVDEAPYHPGYEDAVITPEPVYKGMDPAKMLWKPKPLSDEEIKEIWMRRPANRAEDVIGFVRAIEERHGIK